MDRRLDLQINQGMRRVLVRHWVDLGRLVVRSIQGVVTVRGSLQRIAGQPSLEPHDVGNIFDEIRRIKEVRRLTIDLTDWSCEMGAWRRKEIEVPPRQGSAANAPGTQKTYRLTRE